MCGLLIVLFFTLASANCPCPSDSHRCCSANPAVCAWSEPSNCVSLSPVTCAEFTDLGECTSSAHCKWVDSKCVSDTCGNYNAQVSCESNPIMGCLWTGDLCTHAHLFRYPSGFIEPS